MVASLVLAMGMPAAVAGSASWAHQAGSLSSNGSVTVKSLSGGSYSTTQNPAGAVAKVNQNAVTQPPTVIIQATSSGLPFSYKDDCYIFKPFDATQTTKTMIGAGKIDASNNFTGILGQAVNGDSRMGSSFVLAALTGAGNPSAYGGGTQLIPSYVWCGSNAACVVSVADSYNSNGGYGGYGINVIGVSALPTTALSKCYP